MLLEKIVHVKENRNQNGIKFLNRNEARRQNSEGNILSLAYQSNGTAK